ncbi:MAG TPA: hypothetical protein VFL14_12740 [Xanthomonadales bacterium]|nr:hypothetical protein [Xanthomonadales bacterium]
MVTVVLACTLLAGCVAPRGRLAPECTGVPGDFRTPAASVAGDGEPVPRVVRAVARPYSADVIPLVYVFDDEARYVFAMDRKVLSDPIFAHAEKHGFWLEGGYGFIPDLDKCSLSSMLEAPVDVRAAPGGLSFVQFRMPGCAECAQVTAAIEALRVAHPEIPVRWLVIDVPKSIGKLRPDRS